jgi:hypothetical protein
MASEMMDKVMQQVAALTSPLSYVVLEGEKLFAHGTDGRKALAEARQAGAKHPVVVRIEADDELPFGGW